MKANRPLPIPLHRRGFRLLLVILVICFVTIGCRSTKETLKTNISQQTTVNSQQSLSVDSSKVTVDKTKLVTAIDEVITIAEMSKPDSTGKQYTTKVTTITRKQNTAINNDIKQETKVKAKSDYKSESKQKTAVKQTDTKIEQTRTPTWVWVLVPVIALVGIGFIILKRI